MVDDIDVARKYVQLKQNSETRGLPFDLKLADVRRLLSRKCCYYTGVKLCDEPVATGGPVPPNKRTVDRVDNTKGYIRGNVVACAHNANQLKSVVIENPSAATFIGIEGLFAMAKKLKEIHHD